MWFSEHSFVWTKAPGLKAWPELRGSLQLLKENVSARGDVHDLPLELVRGHWYFWESFNWTNSNFAHYLLQYAAKLQHYLNISPLHIGLLVPQYRLLGSFGAMTLEFLRVLHVPWRKLDMDRHYLVDHAYVTPCSGLRSSVSYVALTKLVAAFRGHFRKPLPFCKAKKKMYLTRDNDKSEVRSGVIKNQDSIISVLKKICHSNFLV